MKYLKYPLYFVIGFGASCLAAALFVAPGPYKNEVLEKVRPSMVTLRNPDMPSSGGTGFAVQAPSGKIYTLTNAHICDMTNRDYIFAKKADTDTERYSRVRPIEVIHTADLCLAEAVPGLQPLKVAASSNIARDHIYVVGYPRLNPLTVTEGNYSGASWITVWYCNAYLNMFNAFTMPFEPINPLPHLPNEELQEEPNDCARTLWAVASTAPTAPGNSGSPTVNEAGEVVGVLFAGSGRGESFHVPLIEVQKFLSKY